MPTPLDTQIRTILKQELARLKEGAIAPEEIPDDLPLFDVNEDARENLDLDSLDALELAMAIEEKYGVAGNDCSDFELRPHPALTDQEAQSR